MKEELNMYDNPSRTANLVSSSDVNGTAVYGVDGTKVGAIDHLMIDKQSGKIAYAVMGFGGFLGMGEDYHSIPWAALHYNTNLEGFSTNITPEQLEGAPARPDDWYNNREWERSAYDYYGLPYYWI
jgi:sporulation protein YlmC with PRC-barrel domain